MADLTPAIIVATSVPNPCDVKRAEKFTREAFVHAGETTEAAIFEIDAGAKAPSPEWRRRYSPSTARRTSTATSPTADLYETRLNGVPGVAYAAGVRHAHNLAVAFREQGLKAMAVSGETRKRELAEILASYERGEIDADPDAEATLAAAPKRRRAPAKSTAAAAKRPADTDADAEDHDREAENGGREAEEDGREAKDDGKDESRGRRGQGSGWRRPQAHAAPRAGRSKSAKPPPQGDDTATPALDDGVESTA